jgi:NADPH-dependent 2,4-dienoyl-CoA reductase/sulfur reductase-like enzyme
VVAVDGRGVPFDAQGIATRGAARTMPGAEHLAGVHTLRTVDDARAIRKYLDSGARTVVIGGGFIGSEVASAARKRGLDVTIVEALPTPLPRSVGMTAGAALAALHSRNGTTVRCGVAVTAVEGRDHVTGARLSDGSTAAADLVVVGIGARPAIDWLVGSGITLDNGIVCDETLATSVAGVYAAGDVARWTNQLFGWAMRLEHWTSAAEQGAYAMRNALCPGAASPYPHVPYFWSDWYGNRIQFAGIPNGEPTVVSGSWGRTTFRRAVPQGRPFGRSARPNPERTFASYPRARPVFLPAPGLVATRTAARRWSCSECGRSA